MSCNKPVKLYFEIISGKFPCAERQTSTKAEITLFHM